MIDDATHEGHCRCGQVRLRISARPLLTLACHCVGCRRMTASAFSLSAAIPSEAFEVLEGEPVIGGLHGASRHYHCPHCKSWLFTRPEGMDWLVNVRSTMFEDATLSTPFVETCTAEKLSWAVTAAVHSFETIPPVEGFGPLVAEFAERAGRPAS